MAKDASSGVVEAVKVVDRVHQATRIFLGTALSIGFISVVMGGIILPKKQTPPPLPALKGIDVIRAVSVRDPLETKEFTGQAYYAGGTKVYQQPIQAAGADTTYLAGSTNQSLSIIVTPKTITRGRFGIPTAQAQSTTFSIETIPFSGLTAQYILVWYRMVGDKADRLTTVCLGETLATSVYIGLDGSTYTDSGLTKRTTARSCTELKALNTGVEQLSQGVVVAEPTNQGIYNVVRTARILAKFDHGQYINDPPPTTIDPIVQAQVLAHYRTPLWIGFGPDDVAGSPINLIVPAAIFTLTDTTTKSGQTLTQVLCHPGGTYNETTTGPVFYFDKEGNAYSDMFLTNRLMTTTCPELAAKSLKVTTVTTASTITSEPLSGAVQNFELDRSNHRIGAFRNGLFEADGGAIAYGGIDPLVVWPSADLRTGTLTSPRSVIALKGMYAPNLTDLGIPVDVSLCVPQATWTTPAFAPVFYFDKDGNAYSDLFLTNRLITSDCPTIISRGLKVTSVEQATGSVRIDSSHALYLYNKGQLKGVIDGQAWQEADNREQVRELAPLSIALGGGTGTDVIDTPNVTVTMNYNLGQTLNMCFPAGLSVTPAKYFVFYDTAGLPYKDLFLLDPYICPTPIVPPVDEPPVDPGIILR